MYLFNTFLQMHINHHRGLFLFFHCTIVFFFFFLRQAKAGQEANDVAW